MSRTWLLLLVCGALVLCGCAMDDLVARCQRLDQSACELACQRGIQGDGGCLGLLGLLERKSLTSTDATSTQRLLQERQNLLERTCKIASEDPAPNDVYWHNTHSYGPLELQVCSELARTTLLDDIERSRKSFALACRRSAQPARCSLKFDERLTAAVALTPRCRPPALSGLAGGTAGGFQGALDDDRLLACSELATLLDPIRGRILASRVCAARDLDSDTCKVSELVADEAATHALRQPLLWLGEDAPEPVLDAPSAEASGHVKAPEPVVTLLLDDSGSPGIPATGGLDGQALHGVLDSARPRFAACYAADDARHIAGERYARQRNIERGRPATPLVAPGPSSLQVRLTFEIDAVGIVYRTQYEALGPGNPSYAFGECLQQTLKTLHFAVSAHRTHTAARLSFEIRRY